MCMSKQVAMLVFNQRVPVCVQMRKPQSSNNKADVTIEMRILANMLGFCKRADPSEVELESLETDEFFVVGCR